MERDPRSVSFSKHKRLCLSLGAVCVTESTGVRPSHRLPNQPGHPPVYSAVDGVAVPACRTHNRDVPPASGPCKLRPTDAASGLRQSSMDKQRHLSGGRLERLQAFD